MKVFHFLSSMLFMFSMFSVFAEDSCESYLGTAVSAISFDDAFQKITVLPSKGEFETTAEYKTRIENIQIPAQLIIARKADITSDGNRDLIFYNADTKVLKISEFSFRNMNVGAHLISQYNTPELDFDFNAIFYHSVPFSEKKISTEHFSSSNSFGATVEVQKDYVEAELLIDPRKAGMSVSMFKNLYSYSLTSKENNNVVGEVSLTPIEAKSVKEAESLAFVVEPSKPYKFVKSYTFPEAKINSPYEKGYSTKVLVAKIQCGLWLNADNSVIGAYPINFSKN